MWGCLDLLGTSNLQVIKVFVLKAVIFKVTVGTGDCRNSFCHLLCILEYPYLTLSEIKFISSKGSACSRFVCLSPNRKFSTHVSYSLAPSTPLKILFSSVSFCLCPTSPLPPLHSSVFNSTFAPGAAEEARRDSGRPHPKTCALSEAVHWNTLSPDSTELGAGASASSLEFTENRLPETPLLPPPSNNSVSLSLSVSSPHPFIFFLSLFFFF